MENLGERVDAYRFFSIKFDSASYRAFIDSCDRLRDRVSLRLRLFCEPSEAAFKRFLEKGGLKFLADHTPSGREYDDISAILRVATAPASPAASAAASSGAPAGPPSGAATAARAAAPEQIEGSG